MDTPAINKARIVYYGLFSSLFSFGLDEDKFSIIEKAVDILRQNPVDEQSSKALNNMQRRLKNGGYIALKNESDRIFYNPVTTCVPMTASFYIEQRDGGSKRIEMINYVQESKFRRNTSEYKEHEDHVEFILLFIQKLIHEELQGDLSSQLLSRKIFENVLNHMIDEFTDTLFNHKKSYFYKQVALAFRSFADFERLFFNINKPEKIERDNLAKPNITKDKQPSKECVKIQYSGCV